ncbi:sugar transferase [Parasphingorhabdus sp.]|uniref:sugar transferase n=1 Tax=Parasphingorhabdus sp. TaxID=2709688 RepID=UPI003A9388A6
MPNTIEFEEPSPISSYERTVGEGKPSGAELQLIAERSDKHDILLKRLMRRKRKRFNLIALHILADLLAIVFAFALANLFRFGEIDVEKISKLLFAITSIYVLIALNSKAYQTSILTDLWKSVGRSAQSFLLATGVILLILFLFKTSEEISRVMFGFGTMGAVAMITLMRFVLFKCGKIYLGKSPYADLCIYDGVAIGDSPNESAILADDYGLVADPSDPVAVNHFGCLVSDLDRIIVHCPPEKRNAWVFMLRAQDVMSEIVTLELDAIGPLAIKQRSGHTSLLISAGHLRWDQKILKRTFDLFFGTIALIGAMPIMIVTAIAIKIESRGPVLFRQERIGLGSRTFKICKFRSMRTDLADATGSKLTERDDPRVTAVGEFIRRTSIDELPQLFNVLGGTMSLVGPRPHPIQAKAGALLYWEVEPEYWHRHSVKPGITGLAQVNGHRGNTFVEDDLRRRLRSDLVYAANWSILNDLKILLKTLSVVLRRNENAF